MCCSLCNFELDRAARRSSSCAGAIKFPAEGDAFTEVRSAVVRGSLQAQYCALRCTFVGSKKQKDDKGPCILLFSLV